MSLDVQSRSGSAGIFEADFEFDLEAPDLKAPWTENVVTATVAAFTVLFVSSVAVLMYLA